MELWKLRSMATDICELMNGATRLQSDRATDEQGVFFLSLWKSALARVHVEFRDMIERYWRGPRAPETCRTKANVNDEYDPRITLCQETQDDEGAAPQVTLDGHGITFPARFMDELRRDCGVVAIVHELAHVSFNAEAEANHWPSSKSDATINAAERFVDARLLARGLTQQELDVVDAFLASRAIPRFRPE
jgi:hypothetical protein